MLPLLFTPNPFCAPSAAFFGIMGVALCLIMCNAGSAYATAKSGIGLAYLSIMDRSNSMKGLITAVFGSVMSIYGVVMSAVIVYNVKSDGSYSTYSGFAHFAAGVTCGMTSLAAGGAIGVVSDAGLRNFGLSTAVFVPMILLLIFSEVLAILGIIIGVMVTYLNKGPQCQAPPKDPIG